MSIFEYKGQDATALVGDALDLMSYSYHGLSDALGVAYQQTGFSLATAWKALFLEGEDAGLLTGESEQAARDKIESKGWTVLTPEALGFDGATIDRNGTFQGETFKFKNAQADVLAKYDDAGNVIQVGLAFRGTTGTIDNIVTDTIGDVIDYLEFLKSEPHYVEEAFGGLLASLKNFMEANGLEAEDLVVTGHSLGGGAVTNMAEQSDGFLDGFFVGANYLGFASHYAPEDGSSVLDSGAEIFSIDLENDPVPSVISERGVDITGNDTDYEYDTSNIVLFNDLYDTPLYWDGGNILNLTTWSAHLPFAYETVVEALQASQFSGEMDRDSLVIISGLSERRKGDTWVEDISIPLDTTGHYGDSAYILGSATDDLLRGNRSDDTLEGFSGDDFLRGEGGNDRLLGGDGNDRLEGGNGDDVLFDGAGTDVLIGGNGADTFVFAKDGATDVIEFFNASEDVIDLSDAGITSLSEVELIQGSLWDAVTIRYGDEEIKVSGTLLMASQFSDGNFLFA
ncbi:triacylglycerol lipase [Pseudovibrio exalbescens]|uniref:triacylglycerol lipase n=1 Tax=Pseudovibrio exalbescens TaxID=197461 RepID=UPI0023660338|nr:triacylglycerol lipase [Pseudovibrio exalbescens]MDD7910365.1 triacylglycerol lipase [Pseudovibrio exalbescens]